MAHFSAGASAEQKVSRSFKENAISAIITHNSRLFGQGKGGGH